MRKLIVSNFQTLDGYYESANKTFEGLFDYYLEDYGKNEAFEEYNKMAVPQSGASSQSS